MAPDAVGHMSRPGHQAILRLGLQASGSTALTARLVLLSQLFFSFSLRWLKLFLWRTTAFLLQHCAAPRQHQPWRPRLRVPRIHGVLHPRKSSKSRLLTPRASTTDEPQCFSVVLRGANGWPART